MPPLRLVYVVGTTYGSAYDSTWPNGLLAKPDSAVIILINDKLSDWQRSIKPCLDYRVGI